MSIRQAVVSLLVLMAGWPAAVSAADSSLLFGQQHSYSVTLRGNGEAIVTARLVITNHTDKPVSLVPFSVAGATIADVVGYQQVVAPTACVTTLIYPAPPCTPTEPDYTQQYYNDSQSSYTKVDITASGSSYEVKLPVAVAPQKSTAVIMSYAARGFVKASFVKQDFAFQTLKVPDRVTSVTVAVSTDSDLYLEGGSSRVSYNQPSAMDAKREVGASASTAQLNRMVAYIGHDGTVIKTGRNLAAGETFTVKGAYADAAWKLDVTRYLITGALISGLVLLLVLASRRLRRRGPAPAAARITPAGWRAVFEPLPLLAGWGSAAGVIILTWWLAQYSPQLSGRFDAFTLALANIIVLLLFGVAALGPLLWIGLVRHNWRTAGLTVVWQVAGLIFMLSLYTIVWPSAQLSPDQKVYPAAQDSSAGSSTGSSAVEPASPGAAK